VPRTARKVKGQIHRRYYRQSVVGLAARFEGRASLRKRTPAWRAPDRSRRHLKTHDHTDRILRRIAEGIEEQIDCTQCANCCRVATVKLSERDVERLARYLRLTPAAFLKQCTTENDEEGTILRRTEEAGCVFLDGTACTVYDARPDICQRFPHLVRSNGSIASRMWQFTDRACYCPIV